MRGRKATVRGKGWQRCEIEPAKAGALFRTAGYTVSEGDPIEARAHMDRQGRWRRLHGRWADGWRCTIVLHLDGTQSLSMALKLETKPTGGGE